MTEQEFIDFINENRRTIKKACNTYCKHFDHADLFQEIVLETWQSISKFKNNSTFNTWLHAIARNTCIDYLRKHVKQPEIVSLDEYEDVLAEVDNSPEMFKQLQQAMRYDTVLNNLTEEDSNLLELYLHGLSYKEIEQQTGICVNMLTVKIHRIRKRLYLRYGKSENIK